MPDQDFECPPELERFLHYQPAQPGPTPANLQELEQLLYAIWGKQTGKTETDQQVLARFQALCGLDQDLVEEQEQHFLRRLDKKQPVLVGLDTEIHCHPGQPSVLGALVMNPTETLFREVRIRFRSPDLCQEDHSQPRPIRLLDGRDTLPVYFGYRAPQNSTLTTLALEVDVCDHRGEWRAYTSRFGILLQFPDPGRDDKVKLRAAHDAHSALYRRGAAVGQSWGIEAQMSVSRMQRRQALTESSRLPSLEQMLPIELEPDPERTRRLQAESAARPRPATRGTPLTRALLQAQNLAQGPERIELVSRPFMVFGRFNEQTQAGFGDFALGFVPDHRRISRLHCAVRATEKGLAVMHAGAGSQSYTALNGTRLARGEWQRLESDDLLDISGLYTLRVSLALDVTPGLLGHDNAALQGERIGRSLLEMVDRLRQMEDADSEPMRQKLKAVYTELMRMQSRAAGYNGLDSAGTVIYAGFTREDAGQRRVIHRYLPKYLPVGSSPADGLRIEADGVRPHHAELLFKDNLYWIQNRAGQGDVRVCSHNLAPNEAVPLEQGDTVGIGAARFMFERY